jgi:hypothetical protein
MYSYVLDEYDNYRIHEVHKKRAAISTMTA